MLCEVTFSDGYTCTMELIYNWDKCHMYRTPTSYLIVPYKDVTYSRVPIEEFMAAQQAAREASKADAEPGIVWKEVTPKEEIRWKEIKPISSSESE